MISLAVCCALVCIFVTCDFTGDQPVERWKNTKDGFRYIMLARDEIRFEKSIRIDTPGFVQPRQPTTWSHAGIRFSNIPWITSSGLGGPDGVIAFDLHVRTLTLFLVSLIFPLLGLFRRWLRDRPVRRGVCPLCGYDLRATPDCCPECGNAPASKPA